MKNKRREYTAQFYKKNHIAFAAALLSSLLTSALNLYIAWVLQQMIDAVSGVPGSFALSALLWFVLSVIAAIILLKTASYFSKQCFMEKAMKQYKNYAFCKLTRKSISAFGAENTANYISAFSNDAATIENSYLDAQFNILFSLVMLLGDVIMIGAYIAFCATQYWGMSPLLGVLIAMIVCTVLGMVIERLAYKPLRQATSLAVLITAIGVSYLLQNLALLVFGPNPMSFPSFVSIPSISLFDGQLILTGETIVTVLANIIIMLVLTFFTSHTKMGKAMRAVSEDRSAAELMGIKVNATISLTFAIGSALAAIAGVLLCSTYHTLMPTTGSMPGIKAFTAAVFGGIGSIPGALLGGLLLGIIEILGKAYVSMELGDALVFAVLIIVLLVKPTGLLGKPMREKV